MRYFKCGKINTDENEIVKAHLAKAKKQERRQYRRDCVLIKIGHVVFAVVSVAIFFVALVWLSQIVAEAPGPVAVLFQIIFVIFFLILAIVASLLLGMLAALPFWAKKWTRREELIKEHLHKACETLREYYGFQEPFLVTKCYSCTDCKFDRHDVCLYVVEDELRITANLNYGFFHPGKDLGCYGLTREEITLSPAQHKESNAVQLDADGVTFLLGTRAQGFIKANFLNDYGN